MLAALRKSKKHVFIAGVTQTGKTHCGVEYGRGWPGPVLFFNPQDFQGVAGYVNADGRTEAAAIVNGLKRGVKVNYVPGRKRQEAAAELNALVDLVFSYVPWSPPLLFIIDETHFYSKDAREGQIGDICRVGLRFGVVGCFISQSPADTSKVLLRQSDYHLVFRVDLYDLKYFKERAYPVEKIQEIHKKGGQYSFAVYNFGAVTGPFKV